MASEQHNFLKLEDLHASSPSATSTFDHSQSTPPPVIVQSKPAKKRKSWGQQLPEPTTTLPPRKRAKTQDEKEQRRIERIKRNRAAAHNSRERKRQETETLAVALARVQAELDAYRQLHGPLPAHIQLPEVTLSHDDDADTPAPSLVESRGSVDAAGSPASPAEDLFDSQPIIKREQNDLTYPTIMPPAFEVPHDKSNTLSLLDPTQHSAAMLCDLQCRSKQHQPFDFSNYLVDNSLPLSYEPPAPDLLQDDPSGHMEPFAFTNGAFDASFNAPLDFSFEEFIDDSATSVAVDHGFGAA
ncbi:transcription factor that binds to CRE motif [Vermiconidia calcicola]|uniref:Transcription factor that binds to CRE motif n=1 Tax=Vermiconidia calcicola TaxID=1690605 RepID=A0ACC3N665_9PEZI|nr:transcription factor that binds to CRE motif [Vermiconidia calcicola]